MALVRKVDTPLGRQGEQAGLLQGRVDRNRTIRSDHAVVGGHCQHDRGAGRWAR